MALDLGPRPVVGANRADSPTEVDLISRLMDAVEAAEARVTALEASSGTGGASLPGVVDVTATHGGNLQEAVDALPSYGGHIMLRLNTRYDVGDGLIVGPGKAVEFTSPTGHRSKRWGGPNFNPAPMIYSSTGAPTLVTVGTPSGQVPTVNTYGCSFHGVWFEPSATTTVCLYAQAVNMLEVDDCGFHPFEASSLPDCVGIYGTNTEGAIANAWDLSWSRITNNSFNRIKAVHYQGNNSNNRHVIRDNVCIASATPLMHFDRISGSDISHNNLEGPSPVGIYMKNCHGNTLIGNAGEGTNPHMDMSYSSANFIAPLGNKQARAAGPGKLLVRADTNSYQNVFILPTVSNADNYYEDNAYEIRHEANTVITGRFTINRKLGMSALETNAGGALGALLGTINLGQYFTGTGNPGGASLGVIPYYAKP